jgi:anti-sigma B factor antagonist
MSSNQNVEMKLLKVDRVTDCIVIQPQGELNSYNAESLRRQVMKVMEEGFRKLIFDCAQVPYMSSAAVGLLPGFLKEAKARQGNMAMINLQPNVRNVIQLLGLTLFLNVMDSMAEALEFIALSRETALQFPRVIDCVVCGHRMRVGRSGWFRCSECKTLLRVDPAGRALPSYAREENDFDLVPEKTEEAIRLLGDLSKIARQAPLAREQREAFKKAVGQIVLNLYQREVKDVWAELEEVRS